MKSPKPIFVVNFPANKISQLSEYYKSLESSMPDLFNDYYVIFGVTTESSSITYELLSVEKLDEIEYNKLIDKLNKIIENYGNNS